MILDRIKQGLTKETLIQYILQVVNHYLNIWLVIQYWMDGFKTHFIILLVLIGIERLIFSVRGIILHYFQERGFLTGILLNLFFIDYSHAFEMDENYTYYSKEKFFFINNIIVHFINATPTILNLQILMNEKPTSDNLYLAVLIYGFLNMVITDFIMFFTQRTGEESKATILYYLLLNASKKVCFYFLIADLISYHIAFISFYTIYFAFEFTLYVKSTEDSPQLFSILNMQYIFAFKQLVKMKADAYFSQFIYYLTASCFSYSMLTVLFIVRVALHHGNSAYDISIYVTFAFNIYQSIYTKIILYQFWRKEYLFFFIENIALNNENYQQEIEKVNSLLAKSKFTYQLTLNVSLSNNQLLYKQELRYFFQKLFIKYRNRSIVNVNNQDGNQALRVISSQQLFNFQLTFAQHDIVQFLLSFIEFFQKEKLDYQKNIIEIELNVIDELIGIKLKREIHSKIYQFFPKTILINGEPLDYGYIISPYLTLLTIYTTVAQHIPVNKNQLLYDLYDD